MRVYETVCMSVCVDVCVYSSSFNCISIMIITAIWRMRERGLRTTSEAEKSQWEGKDNFNLDRQKGPGPISMVCPKKVFGLIPIYSFDEMEKRLCQLSFLVYGQPLRLQIPKAQKSAWPDCLFCPFRIFPRKSYV